MKRILVAPLDWGLGHATRCMPVINELLQAGADVMIAGSGDSLSLLRSEFPQLTFIDLPAYNPKYPLNGSMVAKMVFQLPHFAKVIRQEYRSLQKIISDYNIQGVISDNRYGCWTNKVPCVFITHQSNILMPRRFGWLAPIVRSIVASYMTKFDACWIPDLPGHVFSGKLSLFEDQPYYSKISHVGPLSRFQRSTKEVPMLYDVVAVISGPEPQRTIFEDLIGKQLENSQLNYFLVRGLTRSRTSSVKNNTADFLTAEPLQKLLESSAVIIARSGYSTIMDMAALGKKVVFVPTPGQTEQEYLAKKLMDDGVAFCMEQRLFNLSEALVESQKFPGFAAATTDTKLLKTTIASWLEKLNR